MGNPLRVLIVEDSKDDALLVIRELERGGYDTMFERVETAEAMATALDEQVWDIILVDYHLPHFSASGALKLIHKDKLDLPFIVISDAVGEETAVAVMKSGAHDYLMKSNLTRLVPAVERELYEAEVRKERRHTQEELQIAEQNFRNSLDNSPLGICIAAMEGELLYANQAILDIYGYSSLEEMKAVPKKRHYTSESYAEYKERRESGKPTPSNYEVSIIRKDGKIRHLTAFHKAVVWNGEVQFQTIYQDVTEGKQAVEALRESEEKFAKAFRASPDAISIVTVDDGRIIDVNEGFTRFTGYSPEEAIGKTSVELGLWAKPEEHDRLLSLLNKHVRFSNEEFSSRMKSGEVRIGLFSTEILNIGGRQCRMSVIRDITERKQAEEKEEQLQQELILTSRLATVGKMAAGIAHEINNPLTGVIGFSGLLLKKAIPEDIRNDVNIIYDGAQRIASITSRMLTFARQNRSERTSTNINDIIENTLAMRSYEMKSSNIKVTTELAPDLPVTTVDTGQMQQVFLNIILNAEIEMKKAHQGGNLTVKTERINNTIRVSFKDDGLGMPKKNLERIFEPFFTTREVGEGTGLGLSVSYGIVTQHGGKIYAKSRLGKGATFIVELPVVTKTEQLKLAEPAAEKKKLSGAKILVVDDEPMVQDLLNEILSDEGCKVEIVENGDDALERLGSKDYDVILLDVKLPGLSGIELYEHIQRTAKSLASRVVFVTGDVMSADTMTYVLSAGVPYITKPFDAEQLLKGIDRILSQKS